MTDAPILQFGTSRFLQAHADLFVAEALKRGEALGRIAVVQTSGAADRAHRVEAFNRQRSFPVRIRGLRDGAVVDETVEVDSVVRGWSTAADWPAVAEHFATRAELAVTNTADRGFEPTGHDTSERVPDVSFPAKLTALLRERHRAGARPISIIATELISDNAAVLRGLVLDLAARWGEPADFLAYVREGCVWSSSLVDRIVSEPIEPIGAVAEPYAIWAIEARPGLAVPCIHPDVVVTDDLDRYVRLKLHILNLGHTYLAEMWRSEGLPEDAIVLDMMNDQDRRGRLESLYEEEVLPIFAAIGLGDVAPSYRDLILERFANPFLKHYLREIAGNHAVKKERRVGRLLQLAREAGAPGPWPRLEALLAAG
jgi:tagaturonate reductase